MTLLARALVASIFRLDHAAARFRSPGGAR